MAHTDPESPEPAGIIQQKPPPPPVRAPAPDDEKTPGADDPAPQAEAAPRSPSSPPPGRRARRPPSGHVIIPQRDPDPEIISRAGSRPRMDSAPDLTLIDYPRITSPSHTRLQRPTVTMLAPR